MKINRHLLPSLSVKPAVASWWHSMWERVFTVLWVVPLSALCTTTNGLSPRIFFFTAIHRHTHTHAHTYCVTDDSVLFGKFTWASCVWLPALLTWSMMFVMWWRVQHGGGRASSLHIVTVKLSAQSAAEIKTWIRDEWWVPAPPTSSITSMKRKRRTFVCRNQNESMSRLLHHLSSECMMGIKNPAVTSCPSVFVHKDWCVSVYSAVMDTHTRTVCCHSAACLFLLVASLTFRSLNMIKSNWLLCSDYYTQRNQRSPAWVPLIG